MNQSLPVMLFMRVYAIWNRSKMFLGLYGIILLVSLLEFLLGYSHALRGPLGIFCRDILFREQRSGKYNSCWSVLRGFPVEDSQARAAGPFVSIFGKGCLVGNVTDALWIFHFVLLINETSVFFRNITVTQDLWDEIFTVMLTLTLVKAYIVIKSQAGPMLSRGYRLVAHDGIAYFILIACELALYLCHI